MKKKFMLCTAAALVISAISPTSCSKTPVEKIVGLYKDGIEKMNDAKSEDEIKKINNDTKHSVAKIEEGNKDYNMTDEEKQLIDSLFDAYRDARQAARDRVE